MTNPLGKIKKLRGRSLEEIRARSGQAFSAYTEQIGIGGRLPSDRELCQLADRSQFTDRTEITPGALVERFYESTRYTFFPSFLSGEETLAAFRSEFGEEAAGAIIGAADKVRGGRFDLLGFRDLDFGTPVDWHYEPLSDKQSPLKHWKQFDELETRETGDKKIIWELNRHQHFFTLGVAYRLTGDEDYARTFAAQLEDWMEQNPPGIGINWFSSLEVALRTMSWLWAFQFFRGSEALTVDLLRTAFKYLLLHGRHLEKYLSTYYSPNTHLTGEALGLYYLGTQLSFFERAEFWRELGEEILLGELDRQVHPDGVYFEQSTWYQRYTADFYLQFVVLRGLQEEPPDPDDREKLYAGTQSLLDFMMHATRPDGTTPLIGDDDGGRCLPLTGGDPSDFRGSLAVGSVLFKRGDYRYVAGEVAPEVLWLLGTVGMEMFDLLTPEEPAAESKAFPEGGYYVMRDGWTDKDNFMLVDAGDIGALKGGHGHADTLAFELAVGGRPVLVDSGTYTYHKSKELRDYFRSATAHNTLTIDEQSSSVCGGKFDWDATARPVLRKWISEARFDFFEAGHDGYRRLESSPAEVTRSILFLKNDYWIMRDFVKTAGEHEYQLNFHFDARTHPAVETDSGGVPYVGEAPADGVGLRLYTFGDNGGWQRKEAWISPRYGERVNAPFMRFVSSGIGPQEFFTFLLPAGAGAGRPEVIETEVVGGRAFVISYRRYQDLLVFADDGQIVRTEFFNTDFRFLWARLSDGEKLPEEFVLIGGRHFTLGDREVINHPKGLEHAFARRLGNRLNVRSNEGVFSVSLPRRASKTYILKAHPEL